jgi:hypothetical protein
MHLAMKHGTTSHPLASSPLFSDLAQGLTAQQSGSWNQALTAAMDPCIVPLPSLASSTFLKLAVLCFDSIIAQLTYNYMLCFHLMRSTRTAKRRSESLIRYCADKGSTGRRCAYHSASRVARGLCTTANVKFSAPGISRLVWVSLSLARVGEGKRRFLTISLCLRPLIRHGTIR